jgi:hypothetical protein
VRRSTFVTQDLGRRVEWLAEAPSDGPYRYWLPHAVGVPTR